MKEIFNKICKIFKKIHNFLKITREIFFNIIFIILLCILIVFLFNKKKKNINSYDFSKKRALIIKFKNTLKEEPITYTKKKSFFEYILGNFKKKKKSTSVFDLINKINQAKNDPKISGIILDFNYNFHCNNIILEYLGKNINKFKKTGKIVLAIGEKYNQDQYYLASFSNKIFLSRNGSVKINGISNKTFYFKKFLNKFNIHPHIFKIGKYKTSVDPYLYNKQPRISKKNDCLLINYIWNRILKKIAKNRNTTIKKIYPPIKTVLKELKKNNNNKSEFAKKHKLVDFIKSPLELKKILIHFFGFNSKTKSFNFINLENYKKNNIYNESKKNDKIAIIFINGALNIKNRKNVINIIKNINLAKKNPLIKAIVLRINSPGGNSKISELLRKEIYKINLYYHKPVVISMGKIATSGGYWISMAGNYIIAHPTTLTGSIGVFYITNTFEKLLSHLGINYDGTSNYKFKKNSIYENLNKDSEKLIKLKIKCEYIKFIKLVAKNRKKKPSEIHKISQGKKWLGISAKKIGLIDKLGDIDTALKKAAKLANIKKYQIYWGNIKKYKTFELLNKKIQYLINLFISKISNLIIKKIFIQKNILYWYTKHILDIL